MKNVENFQLMSELLITTELWSTAFQIYYKIIVKHLQRILRTIVIIVMKIKKRTRRRCEKIEVLPDNQKSIGAPKLEYLHFNSSVAKVKY